MAEKLRKLAEFFFRFAARYVYSALYAFGGTIVLKWIADHISIRCFNGKMVVKKRTHRVFQVLTFHRVGPDADGVFDPLPPHFFEKYIQYLVKYYRLLTAGEAWALAVGGNLPPGAVVITFDDGYRDNYQYAFPILKKYNVPATLFLATGPTDLIGPLWHDLMFAAFACTKEKKWNFNNQNYELCCHKSRAKAVYIFAQHLRSLSEKDREIEIVKLLRTLNVRPEETDQRSPMLTWSQAREMSEWGIEIGAHTMTHPILSMVPVERQREEIEGSIERIEAMVGVRPKVFAYPNGRLEDFNAKTVDILKNSGIQAAYTTIFGTNSRDTNPYYLNRGAAWATELPHFAFQLAWNRLLS